MANCFSALNEVAASVWYASSTPVDLDAGLNDQLRCIKINETIVNEEKTEDSGSFSDVKYKYENPIANLDMHALTSL